jgi:hypothetical protein
MKRPHARAKRGIGVLLAAALGCSSSSLKPAGTACNSDSECAAGLSCASLVGTIDDGGCTAIVKACSKMCTLDSDCAPLGPSFKCFVTCDGIRACGATQ